MLSDFFFSPFQTNGRKIAESLLLQAGEEEVIPGFGIAAQPSSFGAEAA